MLARTTSVVLLLISLAPAGGIAQEWEEVRPGGDTGCGRGADYAFYFRPGTSNNLVIDFEGGGGCWDALTCLLPTWTTTPSRPGSGGLLSTTNQENPTLGWSYLYVPYCTGDVHVGQGTLPASGVHFNGRANAQSALNFVFNRLERPGTVLTTGCSAGALGADIWAPFVANHYLASRHVLFGDSFVGVTNAGHWATLIQNWDLLGAFFPAPGLAPEDLREFREDINPYIIATTARAFPSMEVGQFTFNADTVQAAFAVLAGGPFDWTATMRRIIRSALVPTGNSALYIAAGAAHCVIPGNGMYTVAVEGLRLIDWLRELITARPAEEVVDCCADTHTAGLALPQQAAGLGEATMLDAKMSCAANFSAIYQQRHGVVNGTVGGARGEMIVKAYQSYCGALAMANGH